MILDITVCGAGSSGEGEDWRWEPLLVDLGVYSPVVGGVGLQEIDAVAVGGGSVDGVGDW